MKSSCFLKTITQDKNYHHATDTVKILRINNDLIITIPGCHPRQRGHQCLDVWKIFLSRNEERRLEFISTLIHAAAWREVHGSLKNTSESGILILLSYIKKHVRKYELGKPKCVIAGVDN